MGAGFLKKSDGIGLICYMEHDAGQGQLEMWVKRMFPIRQDAIGRILTRAASIVGLVFLMSISDCKLRKYFSLTPK